MKYFGQLFEFFRELRKSSLMCSSGASPSLKLKSSLLLSFSSFSFGYFDQHLYLTSLHSYYVDFVLLINISSRVSNHNWIPFCWRNKRGQNLLQQFIHILLRFTSWKSELVNTSYSSHSMYWVPLVLPMTMIEKQNENVTHWDKDETYAEVWTLRQSPYDFLYT